MAHSFEESCNCSECCEVRGGNLAGREADLVNTLCHVFGAVKGDDRSYHLQWIRYHLMRATQGMPEKTATDLHELLKQFEGLYIDAPPKIHTDD